MKSNSATRILRTSSPFALPSSSRQCLRTTQPFRSAPSSQFSTTLQCQRDNNRQRGLSAIKASGTRGKFRTIKPSELPKPQLGKAKPKIEVDEKHGLWGFFNKEKTLISDTTDDASHGRGWTVEELNKKTWEEMHALWWKCLKEKNRLATERVERERLKPGYGEYEANERLLAVQATMKSIKQCLLERWYAREDAYELAKIDPEIQYDPQTESFRVDYGSENETDPYGYDTSEIEIEDAPSDTQTTSAKPVVDHNSAKETKTWSDIDPSSTDKNPPSAKDDKRA